MPQMAGGKGDTQPVAADTATIVHSVRSTIEPQCGANVDRFEPISQRLQVVAGMNRYVKIRVGENSYAHATIWSKLDGTHQVTNVESNKSATDEL